MNSKIVKCVGREVLDSRGNPTVEVEIHLADGAMGRAIVPSGASKGLHEALELRDGDKKRYQGKGTLKAIENIEKKITPIIAGKNPSLCELDSLMLQLDNTSQKSILGANAILAVSMAYAHALAHSQKRPLYFILNEAMGLASSDMQMPVPLMNILNGGEHANNGLSIQEFMIVPHGFDSFREALRAGVETFQCLKMKLNDRGLSTAVGDEGGFAPSLKSEEQALELIVESIKDAGYKIGKDISLALDVAASSFYSAENQLYEMVYKGKTQITREDLMQLYGEWCEKYPLVSIEDGLQEADWVGWKTFTEKMGSKIQLVGDDLFVTQTKWVEKGIQEKVANAVLIKVNQVGSLKETFDTMALCRNKGYRTVVSHRSGETEDTTIAHLAVASGSGQIKTGSASRGERTAKYNELLRIDDWARMNGKSIPFKNVFV